MCGRALVSQTESSRAGHEHLRAKVPGDGTDPSAASLLQERGAQLTQPGVDVAKDASRLHSDGVDICHSLHVDALLPQDSLDPLCLCQDAHCREMTGSVWHGHKGATALPLAFEDTFKVPHHVEAVEVLWESVPTPEVYLAPKTLYTQAFPAERQEDRTVLNLSAEGLVAGDISLRQHRVEWKDLHPILYPPCQG